MSKTKTKKIIKDKNKLSMIGTKLKLTYLFLIWWINFHWSVIYW